MTITICINTEFVQEDNAQILENIEKIISEGLYEKYNSSNGCAN